MSVINAIYSKLSTDPQLDADLGRSVLDKTGTAPAIYELWPGPNSKMPYMITEYNFPQGNHWAKVNGSLTVSIFVDQRDTIKAERMKNRVISLLDRQLLRTPQDGLVRVFKGPNDQPGGAESPEVVHWIVDFDLRFFRVSTAVVAPTVQ